ncbi:hypothetical protein T552_04060 [Pneumocystis carinii B80]|uniref:Uncharacterized protein n=1 Tax=Pneumocystis carinii (strain B80) TaxID=1408658 RepID=A0A0W4ZT70_PNEC8|nr:hypothetical protein T552_04060 [Pneumocystis carinii B80]KTW31562.1 hypothetical protein T552_04060 [Pneumocystis carinii B80]
MMERYDAYKTIKRDLDEKFVIDERKWGCFFLDENGVLGAVIWVVVDRGEKGRGHCMILGVKMSIYVYRNMRLEGEKGGDKGSNSVRNND